MKNMIGAAFGASLLLLGTPAMAAILIDGSPAPGAEVWGTHGNYYSDQNFAVHVQFAGPVSITAFDIYRGAPMVGDSAYTVELKIFKDNGASAPDLTTLQSYISVMNSYTYPPQHYQPGFFAIEIGHIDFSPIDLAAGDYWIGLAGVTTDIGWTAYDGPLRSPLNQASLLGDTVIRTDPPLQPLAFQIEGTGLAGVIAPAIAGVPEPSTWAMFILGFGAIGGFLRAHRRSVLAAA